MLVLEEHLVKDRAGLDCSDPCDGSAFGCELVKDLIGIRDLLEGLTEPSFWIRFDCSELFDGERETAFGCF